jgi:AIPR protein
MSIAEASSAALRARNRRRNVMLPMSYEVAFKANEALIKRLGEGAAHLVWALALYLEEPDVEALAAEALTDGPNDKKIDFIYLDPDSQRILFAQGYYSQSTKDSAPSNKAADLNTAAAWLLSGDLKDVPDQLKPAIEACRGALAAGEVDLIDLLYVHNLPESVNVTKELRTAAEHLQKGLGSPSGIDISGRELGRSLIEQLYASQESHIEVKQEIECPAAINFTESGPKWRASILSVPGAWLHDLFADYREPLFSANYRGFLGITKRRRINTGIRQTAEIKPRDFWVFNNGITLLTLKTTPQKDNTLLTGVSIINGAQTTGSLGSVNTAQHPLTDVRVLCRIIECADEETITEIVKYNNTQNEVTTWDQYSNDTDQNRLKEEFEQLGYPYSKKRGFRPHADEIGIEDVAQPLVAFHGRYREANYGKNRIFETKQLYRLAFAERKARHVLFVHTLARAIDERRLELKKKSNDGQIIALEAEQLTLMRNLRFKFFFISLMARVLEVVLGRKIDVDTVAFSPDAASSKKNRLVDLVASWSPSVEAVLSYAGTFLSTTDLARKIAEENAVEQVYKQLEALVYAGRSSLQVDAFRKMVSDS